MPFSEVSRTHPDVPLANLPANWLIVGLWEDGPGSLASEIDAATTGTLTRLRERGDHSGRLQELLPLWNGLGLAAERVMLVGLGKRTADPGRFEIRNAIAAAFKQISTRKVGEVIVAIDTLPSQLSSDDVVLAATTGAAQGCIGPGLYKAEASRYIPAMLRLHIAGASDAAITQSQVVADAVALARELVNRPPCDLYPETFAERAAEVAGQAGLGIEIFDEHRLHQERMEALLGVARASTRPARMVVLEYAGAGADAPWLGLVGKGVTFDSGGLSLKTNEQMVDMKCDMAGAAAVLGAVSAIARLRWPVNVRGFLALVENLPGGNALKLGDILRARNGKTIEVLNTDAEGRLILADTLVYAVDRGCKHLVDLATLTGSCMIALGTEVAGLMTNQEDWGERVQACMQEAGERVWELPMDAHYGELIRSNVADIKNVASTRYGGAIVGGKFLEHFVGQVPWVHLDIAGPAWADHETAVRDSGGTGYGVLSLIELARHYPAFAR